MVEEDNKVVPLPGLDNVLYAMQDLRRKSRFLYPFVTRDPDTTFDFNGKTTSYHETYHPVTVYRANLLNKGELPKLPDAMINSIKFKEMFPFFGNYEPPKEINDFISNEDLEKLVADTKERAGKIGLTLPIDTSRIQFCVGKENSCITPALADYDQLTDMVDIHIFGNNPANDLKMLLTHEGAHRKFRIEVLPYCHEKNCGDYYFTPFTSFFNESLAYATGVAFEENPIEKCANAIKHWDGIGSWHFPELTYAIVKTCKSGVSMDDIFTKFKEFLAEPQAPYSLSDSDIKLVDNSGYESDSDFDLHNTICKFMKEKLNQNPSDIYKDLQSLKLRLRGISYLKKYKHEQKNEGS
jgi:hypothetical protein